MTTLPPEYVNRWLGYAKQLKEKEDRRDILSEMVSEAQANGFYDVEDSQRVSEWLANNSTRLTKNTQDISLIFDQIREMHFDMTADCGCQDCTPNCAECGKSYPCPTIEALNGEW